MGLYSVGPFFEKKEAEKRLEEAKQEFEWCYDGGGIEKAVSWEGKICFSVWWNVTARPRPDGSHTSPTTISEEKSAIQQTLF